MRIKALKTELKTTENNFFIGSTDTVDLRTVDSDFVIKQLEEKIRIREMGIEKRVLKKSSE